MSSIIEGIAKDLKAVPKNLKEKAGGIDTKKLVLMNLPYILVGYFCDKVAYLWRTSPEQDASAKMMAVMEGLDSLFSKPLPSLHPRDLLIGAGCGVALRLVSCSNIAALWSPIRTDKYNKVIGKRALSKKDQLLKVK